MRYSSTAKYVLKAKDTQLYLCERAGSMARWGKREEALEQLKSWWDQNLNPDNRKFYQFEKVS